MAVVGLPYTASTQMRIDEITGGSPDGATTRTGSGGERQPSENELELMRFQGRHVAELASKLAHCPALSGPLPGRTARFSISTSLNEEVPMANRGVVYKGPGRVA